VLQPYLLRVGLVLVVDFLRVVEVVPVGLGWVLELLSVGSVLVVGFLRVVAVVPVELGLGSVVLLSCEEGVVDVVRGSTREDEVGGVWQGEEGNVSVGILDGLEGGGVCFIEGIEFGPRGSGGSGGGH
jgi:hypothetical protein